MSRKIFVNLPVRDLKRPVDFFSQPGFTFNKQFTMRKRRCRSRSFPLNVNRFCLSANLHWLIPKTGTFKTGTFYFALSGTSHIAVT
jgi:hypothetical protein